MLFWLEFFNLPLITDNPNPPNIIILPGTITTAPLLWSDFDSQILVPQILFISAQLPRLVLCLNN